ncbi:alpha/beta hydrolase [Granulicella aggregans]|nr:alpha/beta hydrolase [Granulicella aggregans]
MLEGGGAPILGRMGKMAWLGIVAVFGVLATGFWALARPVAADDLRSMMVRDVEKLPSTAPTITEAYGADPLQFGELRMPPGKGPFPVAVIVHGGCWVKGFATRSYMSPLASELTAKGMATWNVEYRQIGDKGAGWPGSYLDWASATDHLRELAKRYPLDLNRVVATGHSAGATAALWLAARGKIAKGSEIWAADPLKIAGVVAIDGPGNVHDFIGLDKDICGQPVIQELMGGLPAEVPARYAAADPVLLLPTGVPTSLVASMVLEPEAAEAYRKAAEAKGDKVEVKDPVDVGHFGMMFPKTEAGGMVVGLILKAGGIGR